MSETFADWRADFRARAEGLPGLGALDGLTPLPEVVAKDRAQAEFTLPARDYLTRVVTPERIARGRAAMAERGATFARIAARWPVPGAVLAAIWGVESDFGANRGTTPTLAALATLAHEGRRRAFFEGEIRALLALAARDGFDPARITGSWAGASGHMQFMPSTALAHAVDLDGDGRADLWQDDPTDALASAAAYLAAAGWQAGADLCARAAWAEGEALFAPAGAAGPVFRRGANWAAVLRYNASELYALAVAALAQAMGGAPWHLDWPAGDRPLSRDAITALQRALAAAGFDAGAADGRIGPATRRALADWQRANGMAADGHPGPEVLARLGNARLRKG